VKLVSVLLAVGCFLSVVHAQWQEAVVFVPDSFGGLKNPQYMTYNSTNNTIYVTGLYSSSVVAIDAATYQEIARIRVGKTAGALCYNPTNNKVYCGNDGDNSVTVIDGATDGVITTVAAGSHPRPVVRGHFAEFLHEGSPERLRILTWPTCVGLRYGPLGRPDRAFLGRHESDFQIEVLSPLRDGGV